MKLALATLAAFAGTTTSAMAQAPAPAPMTLEQTMLLRCSVTFAIVNGQQQRGDPLAAGYPPLAARGKEYFARATARLMDELHLDRIQLEARVRGETAAQQQALTAAADRKAHLDSVMRPCLSALEGSGL